MPHFRPHPRTTSTKLSDSLFYGGRGVNDRVPTVAHGAFFLLNREVGDRGEVIGVRKPKPLPDVMTYEEVKAVLTNLSGFRRKCWCKKLLRQTSVVCRRV